MLKVYGQDTRLLAMLENADAIGYELKHNDLWTGSFQLPTDDPKNDFCVAHNYVRIDDGMRDVGLYRVTGMPQSLPDDWTQYDLEHVMATLVDDVLFTAHEVGGAGMDTAGVLRYILARQTVPRWQLGTCDFTYNFSHHLENCTLLAAMMSVSAVLVEEYSWEWDTATTPWTVSLKRADATPGCGIHYMRNLKQIEKTMDATTLVTRMYCLGYGEGVNQLNIAKVNGGRYYIDADTIGVWGVKCSVFADTTIQDAATLKQRGLSVMEGYKNPYITYTASAVDLYDLTGQSWDNHMPGKLVQVMDGQHGLTFQARIITLGKKNVRGEPQDIEITIANAPKDSADAMNQLADRVGIHELNSQGATSLYVFQFAENCDPSHPATFSVPIPESAFRINTVKFLLKREAYRAYEQGAASGGGTETTSSSSGGGTQTSSAGGTETVAIPERLVSSEKGTGTPMLEGESAPNTWMQPAQITSAATGSTGPASGDTGGPSTEYTGPSGTLETNGSTGNTGAASNGTTSQPVEGQNTASVAATSTDASAPITTSAGGANTGASDNTSHSHSMGGSREDTGNTSGSGSHSHYMYHTHSGNSSTCSHVHYVDAHFHTVYSHSHTVPAHAHGMGHTHTMAHVHSIGGHTHTMDTHAHSLAGHIHTLGAHVHGLNAHTHTVPAHQHGMTHYHLFSHSHTIPGLTITIPDHTHTVTSSSHTHTVTLGTHTHALIYGIFEGTTASSFTLTVDGTAYAEPITSAQAEMDITALLGKDADGKITRGDWHEVTLTPDKATRVVVSVYVQCFVQSKGGGDF